MDSKKILAVAVLVVLSGVLIQEKQERKVVFQSGEENVTATVEIADTPEARKKGLMNRSSLPENHGMLFVFPRERRLTFWMKNTYIPLDIIFVNSDREIVNIERAHPEPGVPDSELTLYRSREPARYVIEMNQNFTRRKDIEKGDRVFFKGSWKPEIRR